MFKFQRLFSASHSLFQLHKVLKKQPENVSNRIIKRIISNSKFLIAGCCFSRQSDEETLLSDVKNNQDGIDEIKTIDHLHPHSKSDLDASNSSIMKRSCEALDDIDTHCASDGVNVPQVLDASSSKRKKSSDEINGIVEGAPQAHLERPKFKVEKPVRHRPNYFVAVKISDDQIHQKLQLLQDHMLEKENRLKKCLIQLSTLHITLMVMYIGDPDTHARAIRTLKNIHREHDEDLSNFPIQLEFRGLGHFQNRVLFAKLCEDDSYRRLKTLADSVKKHFEAASILSTDSRDFNPHLTVMKIRFDTKNFRQQNKFPKKINPDLYKDFKDEYFGSQKVQGIQLLSMTDEKDENGYYSGYDLHFRAFEPKINLKEVLKIEEKKKNVKEMINTLIKDKIIRP